MVNLLDEIADLIGQWFPELEGRSVSVMDAEITKLNVPTLPLAMVAPVTVKPVGMSAQGLPQALVDDIVIEFWSEPQKIPGKDGSESVFWNNINYKPILNKLIYNFMYKGVPCHIAKFVSLNFETTPLAHTLAFRFTFEYAHNFVEPTDEKLIGTGLRKDGDPIDIGFTLK